MGGRGCAIEIVLKNPPIERPAAQGIGQRDRNRAVTGDGGVRP